MIRCLPRDDAQTFVDVIDEACSTLPTITRLTSTCSGNQALDSPSLSLLSQKKWIRLLYRACGQHELLPRTLEVPIYYDRTSDALFRGGYADVWKGECRGRDIAVKVIRTYATSDLQKIIGVGRCTCSLFDSKFTDGTRRGSARR